MRISVFGYNSFKAVIDDVSTPTNVFYVQSGGTVSVALALLSADLYVQAEQVNNTTANFLTEYPGAVEVANILSGDF